MKFITAILIILVLAVSVTAASELNDPVIIGNLGYYAYEQGEEGLAEALFLKALDEDPEYERARFNLATLYHQQGRYGEAIAHLEALTTNNPANVQYQYDLGVNYIANFRESWNVQDFHAGIRAYEAAAAIDGDFAHVQGNLRVLYSLREEYGL